MVLVRVNFRLASSRAFIPPIVIKIEGGIEIRWQKTRTT